MFQCQWYPQIKYVQNKIKIPKLNIYQTKFAQIVYAQHKIYPKIPQLPKIKYATNEMFKNTMYIKIRIQTYTLDTFGVFN